MTKLSKYYTDIHNKNIISVQINLLNECTSKCKYCRKYTWPKDKLDYTALINVITYLKHYHALKSITFSGGDPILYPEIIKVLSYCEKLDIATSLITTLITEDKQLLTQLAKLATRLHVSVDGANKELYLKTRGVDKFDIVKNNIIFVNKIRAENGKKPIRISSTISNINDKTLLELFNFATNTGSTINYYFVHRYENFVAEKQRVMQELSNVANIDGLKISNAKAILTEDFTNDYKKAVKSEYCSIPYIHCLINANGDVYPCCKLLNDNGEYSDQLKYVYGNIQRDALENIFNKTDKLKNICDECNGCEERYIPFIDEVNDIIFDNGDVAFL